MDLHSFAQAVAGSDAAELDRQFRAAFARIPKPIDPARDDDQPVLDGAVRPVATCTGD